MRKLSIVLWAFILFCGLIYSQDGVPWVPQVQLLDNNGDPLASGHVHTYQSGTTTNQATYTDSTLGTPNANPVVLDSAGRANIWLDETLSYRMDVVAGTHAAGETALYSVDNITSQFSATLFTIGTGSAADIRINFDGNAQDFHIGLDDSADDLVFGLGSVLGTTTAFAIDENQVTTFSQDPVIAGTTPQITIGDAGAEDTLLVYDGATQDYYLCLDDTADDAILGLGSACGTTGIIFLDENQDVGLGGASAGAKLDITGNAIIDGGADEVQFTVQANATQTALAFVVEDSSETDVFTIAGTGEAVIDGTADANQLRIQAHSTQTNDVLVVENSAGTDLLTLDNDGELYVSGAGPHSFGGATFDYARFMVRGNYTSGGAAAVAYGLYTVNTITGANGDNTRQVGAYFNNDMTTQSNSETIGVVAQVGMEEPDITVGTDTVTNATTLYVRDAPTEGTNDYGVFVDAGDVRIDDQLFVGVDGLGEISQAEGGVILDNWTVVDATTNGSTLGLGVVTATRSALTAGRTSAGGSFLDLELWAHGVNKMTIQDPTANNGDVLIQAVATDHAALELDTQASPTAAVLHLKSNGTTASAISLTAAESAWILHSRDLGNDVAGPSLRLNINSNASTEGPTAPTVRYQEAAGTNQFTWVDNTGDFRIHTAAPTGSTGSPSVTDTAGTVVGTQTSPKHIKHILHQWQDHEAHFALDRLLETPVYDFTFKDDRPGFYTGLAIDDGRVPWYGQDPATHNDIAPEGTAKALNEINLFGYTILSIKALHQRIEELEKKLEGRR